MLSLYIGCHLFSFFYLSISSEEARKQYANEEQHMEVVETFQYLTTTHLNGINKIRM